MFIIKFESARFTFEIFCFGNVANIPDPSRFWTIGVTSLNGDDVDIPEARTSPLLTPVWTPTAINRNWSPHHLTGSGLSMLKTNNA